LFTFLNCILTRVALIFLILIFICIFKALGTCIFISRFFIIRFWRFYSPSYSVVSDEISAERYFKIPHFWFWRDSFNYILLLFLIISFLLILFYFFWFWLLFFLIFVFLIMHIFICFVFLVHFFLVQSIGCCPSQGYFGPIFSTLTQFGPPVQSLNEGGTNFHTNTFQNRLQGKMDQIPFSLQKTQEPPRTLWTQKFPATK